MLDPGPPRTSGAQQPWRGASPGHDAELAADGVGLLGGTQQLHGAPPVQAELGHSTAKRDKLLPIQSHLPRAGNELVLALKQERNTCVCGRRRKKSPFPPR